MLNKILRFTEKLIPKKIYKFFQPFYHLTLSVVGAVKYKFPARKLKIVGVTGTKGKSTTVEIINSILEKAGHKTAMTSTIHFKIGDEIKPNLYKMSMPGRFFMQKFLKDAVDARCDWVILEMTSEGAKQFRHKFIPLDALIFTNLAPEHIESHGSYKNYLGAKLLLVDNLTKENSVMIPNVDDKESKYFINKSERMGIKVSPYKLDDASPFELGDGIKMKFNNLTLKSKLRGEFNIYNILSAATFASQIGISDSLIKQGIEDLDEVKGRVQSIPNEKDLEVIVDYAHTPESLEALYKAFDGKNKVCILGNTGGGRDKWKRPKMARIADQYCDRIILTNEDPYDEDPEKIVSEMKDAIKETPVDVIMDRRQAIHKALVLSPPKSAILITGKGTDPYIMGANGSKTSWSDEKIVKEELEKLE